MPRHDGDGAKSARRSNSLGLIKIKEQGIFHVSTSEILIVSNNFLVFFLFSFGKIDSLGTCHLLGEYHGASIVLVQHVVE